MRIYKIQQEKGSRLTDIENRLLVTRGEREGETGVIGVADKRTNYCV